MALVLLSIMILALSTDLARVIGSVSRASLVGVEVLAAEATAEARGGVDVFSGDERDRVPNRVAAAVNGDGPPAASAPFERGVDGAGLFVGIGWNVLVWMVLDNGIRIVTAATSRCINFNVHTQLGEL